MPPRFEAQTGASLLCDTNSITFRNQLRTFVFQAQQQQQQRLAQKHENVGTNDAQFHSDGFSTFSWFSAR